MINDIFFSWNELTATIVLWFSCVSLAVGVDFGPEIYRERKARVQLASTMKMLAARKAAEITPDRYTTFQLGVFDIQPIRRGRHARA